MRILLEQFHPRHLENFEPWADVSFFHQMALDPAYIERLCLASVMEDRTSCAYSAFLENGFFLGSCGFIPYPGAWSGTAEAWMFLDRIVGRYPKTLHKFVSERIDAAFKIHNFRRVQTYVDAADNRAIRWIERLGFIRETNDRGLHKHGPNGETYHVYGRVI